RALVSAGTLLRLGATTLELTDGDVENLREESGPIAIRGLIGASPAMRQVAKSIEALASSGVAVLIYGEIGTGKEVVARAIHELSARAKEPFVLVDQGAVPD